MVAMRHLSFLKSFQNHWQNNHMPIWFDKTATLNDILPLGKNTMSEWLGIEFTELGENFISGKMPVDHRTNQPYGLMHGGASCVLAETLGSVASALVTDHSVNYCVGIEINANHIRSAREGYVSGIATPLHLGNSTHVWDIKIYDEKEKLVCVSRLTVAIMKR
jgi:1,4-dihydroxy-2-naphthoyl-CoA hydrolase